MLNYFYTLDYPYDDDFVPNFITDARMYAMGDKYGVEALKTIAARKFEPSFIRGLLGAWTGAQIEAVFTAVDVVFNTTPEADMGLRKIVTIEVLKKLGYLSEQSGFKGMLARNPDLAYSLLMGAACRA